jgi:hypothetical protein
MEFSPPKVRVGVSSTLLCSLQVERLPKPCPSRQSPSRQPSLPVKRRLCHCKGSCLFLVPGWVPIQKLERTGQALVRLLVT